MQNQKDVVHIAATVVVVPRLCAVCRQEQGSSCRSQLCQHTTATCCSPLRSPPPSLAVQAKPSRVLASGQLPILNKHLTRLVPMHLAALALVLCRGPLVATSGAWGTSTQHPRNSRHLGSSLQVRVATKAATRRRRAPGWVSFSWR